MGRREFIRLLGTAATWPLSVQAATEIPVIGVLHTGTAGAFTKQIAAMRQTLKDSGRVEGENIAFEFRWANGRTDLFSQHLVFQQRSRLWPYQIVGSGR
jgi:hypothetical protein